MTTTLLHHLLLLLLPLLSTTTPNPPPTFTIHHFPTTTSNNQKLSFTNTLLKTHSNDQARLQYLTNLVAHKSIVPIASGRQILNNPTYIVNVRIGTPFQSMLMALDISYDVALLPCYGCVGCDHKSVFKTTKSTTFSALGCKTPQCKQVPHSICANSSCTFDFSYGSSTISANLTSDTITLANNDTIPHFAFGCIETANGTSMPKQGLLGLGRGLLSLLAQTQSLYKSTFSYCLPSFKSKSFTGSLRLGPVLQPKRIKFTPLLKNPHRSSLYYIDLIGIRVGNRVVNIPTKFLKFNPVTGAGTIIDSGTVFTRLIEPIYTSVRNAFRNRIGKNMNVTSLGGFDTCYIAPPKPPLTTITFMFRGMNLTMGGENLMIHSLKGSMWCLAMASAPKNVDSVLNVIANMQQQNHRIVFDVPNSRIGIVREQCS